MTEETLSERVHLLAARGFLTNAKILFLGDYDLTSLACLPFAENTEIWVLDVDPAVLDVVQKGSRGVVTTVEHNLKNPLPKRLLSSFDAVFADPPYTPEGVSLFLSRALSALKGREWDRIFLSYGSLDPVRVWAVQKKIGDHGVAVEELRPAFNQYIAAKTISGISDLYVLRPTSKARPLFAGEYHGKIYTYE